MNIQTPIILWQKIIIDSDDFVNDYMKAKKQ